MVSLESNNPIYDNAIEMYFHEYFDNRNIELDGHAYKAVPNNLFQGAFMYVHEKLFKPLEFQGLRKNSTIDYNNGALLEYIVSIYGKLVMQYDIKATQNMFCALTGIHRDTLHSWETSNTRTVIYKDLQGNIINNINEYILNNRGEYVTESSQTHSDLVKKIKSFSHDSAYNGLNDTPVGQITHANNSREAGMEYNRKREAETVQARLLMASELPKLGNIAQQNNGLLSVND
jgi:hypothetical protein